MRFRTLLFITLVIVSLLDVLEYDLVLYWQSNLGYLALARGDLVSARARLEPQCQRSIRGSTSCFRVAVLSSDFSTADNLADVALQVAPDMLTLWLAREAESLLEGGAAPAAVQVADLLAEHFPAGARVETLNRAGQVYARVGEAQKALQTFAAAAALELGNRFSEGWYRTVEFYYRQGEWGEVVDLVSPAQDAPEGPASGNWRQAMYTLALSLDHLGQNGEAERVFQRLSEAYPMARDWPVYQAFLRLGQRDLLDGRLLSAAQRFELAYDMALEVWPPARAEYEASAWQQIESWAQVAAASPDARDLLDQVRALCQAQPESAGCFFTLGRFHAALSQDSQSRQAYARACELVRGDHRSDPYSLAVYMTTRPECGGSVAP